MTRILFLILVLFGQVAANAQSISGKLFDENQNPLPYVNIGFVGLNKGSISSSNGTYHIDISGVDSEKTLRFTSVGFESVEFKVKELKTKQTEHLNITLKKRIFNIQEVVVKPNNDKPIYIGKKRAGKMAWVWSEAINGAEIGTLFRNDKPIFLDKFYFHVRKNYCDSILYRIRIYNGENEYPIETINTKDIRFVSKIKKGWDSVDLSGYNITIDSNFIITLETLESWASGQYRTTHLSAGNAKGSLSYSRASSMAHWTEFGNHMSFKIEIKEYYKQNTNR